MVKYLKNYIIPLAVLIFIVMVTSFTWFKLKKHSKSVLINSVHTKYVCTFSSTRLHYWALSLNTDSYVTDVSIV